jgi:hypothetical protein
MTSAVAPSISQINQKVYERRIWAMLLDGQPGPDMEDAELLEGENAA